MTVVTFSPQAREDLLEIEAFLWDRSPSAADGFVDLVRRRCVVLAEHPEIGRERPEIRAGARSLGVSRWLILYRWPPQAMYASCAWSMACGTLAVLLGRWTIGRDAPRPRLPRRA